jgi:hypothetical protein
MTENKVFGFYKTKYLYCNQYRLKNQTLAMFGSLLIPLAGCVGRVEIAPLPYAHPANTDASTNKLAIPGSGLEFVENSDGERTVISLGKEIAANSFQSIVVYQCKMHPEVVSDKPGRCPICGMKLVLNKQMTEQSNYKNNEPHQGTDVN